MRPIAVLLTVVLFIPAGDVLSGQGLASVAKMEEERRKAVKASGKVYTNNDLKGDISVRTVPPPTNASAAVPVPSAQVPSLKVSGEIVRDSDADRKDEAFWRSRMSEARSGFERLRIFNDALQSRLHALATDIVNRDDPAQRSQLELERQRAWTEKERVKLEMAEQMKVMAEIEEEARKAGVPPGWLR